MSANGFEIPDPPSSEGMGRWRPGSKILESMMLEPLTMIGRGASSSERVGSVMAMVG